MRQRVQFPVFAALLCSSLWAQAQAPAVVERPQLRSGDQWVYQVRDGWTGRDTDRQTIRFERQEGERLIFLRQTTADAEPATVRSDLDLNTCAPMLDSEQEVCARLLQFPIVKGQSVSYERYPLASREGHTQGKCTVAEQESVTVPAGTFDTWRIECQGFWNHRSGSSGSLRLTAWYAPVAARTARIALETRTPGGAPNIKTVTELVSYSLVPR